MDTSIYTPLIMLSIYADEINHHYLKRYIKLIRHYKAIEPQGKRKKGFERHHIFPNNRCSSKFSKDKNNLVLLPLRAHFIAHHLLYKAFPKNREMSFAFWSFCNGQNRKRLKRRITARVYEKSKQVFSNMMSGEGNPNFGKPMPDVRKKKLSAALQGRKVWNKGKRFSPESKEKMSQSKKGSIPWNKGKRHSDETRKMISENLTGKTKGIPKSEETKKRMSEAQKKRERRTCPHCGKVCAVNTYARWHGEQCPQNPDNNGKNINKKLPINH